MYTVNQYFFLGKENSKGGGGFLKEFFLTEILKGTVIRRSGKTGEAI